MFPATLLRQLQHTIPLSQYYTVTLVWCRLIFLAMNKINRLAVVSGERTGQALPLNFNDLYRIDNCWAQSSRLQDIRNLAFLHVAYTTLMRISELARIRLRNLSRAEDGRFIIDVSHAKTIVQAGGLIKAMSAFSSRRLEQWITAAGLGDEPDAYIFSRVHRSNKALLPVKKRSAALQLKEFTAKRGRLLDIRTR